MYASIHWFDCLNDRLIGMLAGERGQAAGGHPQPAAAGEGAASGAAGRRHRRHPSRRPPPNQRDEVIGF